MKPVDQTTFGFPHGNCFSACVASLLELPMAAVPWFMEDDDWFSRFDRWLAAYGFYAIPFKVSAEWSPAGYHILTGKSERGGVLHSVVARGAEIIHDPHPSRAGILTREDIVVLAPFEPKALR